MSKKTKKGVKPATPVQQVNTRKEPKQVTKRSFIHLAFLLILAILPFVLTRKSLDPVMTPRYLLISILVIIFCLFLWIKKQDFSISGFPPLLKWIFLLSAGFGVWNILGLFTAVNSQEVFYGLSKHFVFLLVLFLVYYLVNHSNNFIKDVSRLLTVAAIFHGIVGIFQFYEAGFNDIPGNFPPYGLMANRNLFGSAQVLLIPFVAYICWSGSRAWKLIGSVSMIFLLSSIIISQTRSAWLAAFVFILSGFVLALIYIKTERKKWMVSGAAILVVSALLVLFFTSTDSKGDLKTSLKQRVEIPSGADSLAVQSEAAFNVQERIKIWKKTGELISDNPIMGVGLNNWKLTIPKYGSEGLSWADGLHSPDQPHNDYLLVAAESGIPGLILFAAFWILVLLAGIRVLKSSSDQKDKIIVIFMVAGILSYLSDCMFSFPSSRIEHSLYVCLMAGIVMAIYSKSIRQEMPNTGIPRPLLIAISVFGLINLILAFKRLSFERHLSLAKSYEYSRNYPAALSEALKGKSSWVTIGPNTTPIEVYSGLGYLGIKNYQQALREFNKGLQHHPYLKVLYINKGTVYTSMGQYDSAIIYFNKALELTPKMDIIYYNLGVNYFLKKDYRSALDIFNKVDISKQPRLVEMKNQAEQFLANPPVQN